MGAISRWTESFNVFVARSIFGHFFRLEGSRHEKEIKHTKFTSEVRAGLTTFCTMAYIIAVNATILSDTGGNCVCDDPVDQFCLNGNQKYDLCVLDLHRDLITATAAMAGLSSCLFGVLTNMPVCLAPGMGLNAYFAYHVVGFHGEGAISYNLALTAVFLEGLIFVFLSLIGMRQWLVKIIPVSLKVAAACGIGLYLAEIGLSSSSGIGAISGAAKTPLTIAGCPNQYKDSFGECQSHKMTSPTMWLGVMCGGVLTAYLMMYKVKSAMIVAILLVSVISWPRDTPLTYFPSTALGDHRWEFFKRVVDFRPIRQTLNTLDWNVTEEPRQFAIALFTFLYVDIIDCTATLYSMARFCGVVDRETGDFPRSTLAYCTDASCISIGALLGTSPVTAFIESGAGIAEGGKTGLTAITCGICFLISMFFAPIFAAIPPWATGCTLVIVGCLMMRQIVSVNWRYIGDAIPAFVTVMFIPFAYSAAYGLIAGLMVYTALNGMVYITKIVSGGRIVPDDEDYREYCSIMPHGRRPWFVRASVWLADHLRYGNQSTKDDNASIRSSGSRWEHQDRIASYGSSRELQAIPTHPLLTDPRHEKVLRKT
ncbi:hypothetical protein NX059_006705 [Plenodomus lindquistii]|nr:hypothetical protein NX059_006705 [Plenodomus lindquistii]